MTLPEVAETFHSQGYNVLLYDARSVGESGGQLKNLLDPLQIAEDLSGQCCVYFGGKFGMTSNSIRYLHVCG